MMTATVREARNLKWCEYLAQAGCGNQAAFAAFYDESSPMAYGLALKLLSHPSDAEDLVLEAYMQVWRSASRYDPARGTPLGWLLTIVRSRAIDRLRARRSSEADPETLALVPACPSTSPARIAEDNERSQLIRRAMDQLPPRVRRMVEMAYFQGLSHSEIAEDTGEPLGTVKTRIRRGIQILRESLEDTLATPAGCVRRYSAASADRVT